MLVTPVQKFMILTPVTMGKKPFSLSPMLLYNPLVTNKLL